MSARPEASRAMLESKHRSDGPTALTTALESAPVQRGVVAVPTVVGVTPDRLPAAVALVRGRYAAALPVVLTRVCCATSQEPPPLDFAARPGRYSPGRWHNP